MKILKRNTKEMKLDEASALLNQLRLPTSFVLTPINLEEEEKKFFDSDTYNPIFKYRGVRNKNEEILKKLLPVEKIIDADPRISDFYVSLIASKKQADDLIRSAGHNEAVTNISTERFNSPSGKLFRNACRVLRGNVESYNLVKVDKSKDGKLYEYDEISGIFQNIFAMLNLNDWKVEKSSNIQRNSVRVGIKSKEIFVDEGIKRGALKLKKTIIHEVGTHVLRTVNGLNSGFPALGNSNLPEYLDAEEGLATWNESNVGVLTESSLRRKVALTYAIYIGKDLSFRELYNCLHGIFPKQSAFDITYRVKRGLSDTAKAGIYAKDVVYFRGFRKVSASIAKNPSLYNSLYSGKISIKQCEWVEDGLIPRATNVPTKEQWLDMFKRVGL